MPDCDRCCACKCGKDDVRAAEGDVPVERGAAEGDAGIVTASATAALEREIAEMVVPDAFFANPGDLIRADTKIRVDLDTDSPTFGRIYGIVAPRSTCLLGAANASDPRTCWTIDDLERDDPDLAYAHQGEALVSSPSGEVYSLPIAVLSGDLEHTTPAMTAEQAVAYMENTGTQIARVRYHWHEHGLVLSGILYPSALKSETLAKVFASPVSMEARLFTFTSMIATEGRYRLTGAIFVNQPGFPIRRASAADIGSEHLVINDGKVLVDASDDDAAIEQQAPSGDHVAVIAELTASVAELREELAAHRLAIAKLLGDG